MFEESAISRDIVLKTIVSDDSLRISNHIIVNVKMIPYKVNGEYDTNK